MKEIIAFDFLGERLHFSDQVVYTELRYRNFRKGYILKITPKCVFIGSEPNTDPRMGAKQFHNQVIKLK